MSMPPTAEFVISATSEEIQSPQNSGQAPTITVNGAPFAQLGTPPFSSGFQLVVMDAAGDLTSADSIWFNEYILLQNDGGQWGSVYAYMYAQIIGSALTAQNVEQQLILLASFGLDASMAPNNDGLQFLLQRGAGPDLQSWDLLPDPGSQGSGWVGTPACYVLLGGSGYGYAGGWEDFEMSSGGPVVATVTGTLANNVPPTPASAVAD
jgi:hypothetical protein